MKRNKDGITRRVLGAVSLMGALAGRKAVSQSANSEQTAMATQTAPPGDISMRLTVNGQTHELSLDPRTTLLDALRDHIGLTGTKKGCDHGQCGACTVLVNGVRLNSCMSLAAAREGDDIATIEGLGSQQRLHALQASFMHHDAFQCGYCTPGQICSAVGMMDEIERGFPSAASTDMSAKPVVSANEIRERMSGNICRCAAYPNIVAAILAASQGASQ
jgi:xanthine dehydrogenase YagT iron-sulfur-binding subunit